MLFDPFGDSYSHSDEDANEAEETINPVKVIVSTNQHNILKITNKEEIEEFTRKYKYKPSYVPNDSINWNKVASDGYWGVMITFRKSFHIGCNYQDVFWHSSWDVETLAIWDIRALGDIVMIDNIML